MRRATLIAGLIFLSVATASGKHEALVDFEHPAIQYTQGRLNDAGAHLNFRLQYSEVHLKFSGPQGYLRSLLGELQIPIDSQIVVFSKTSFQSERISPQNPRSLFFNDSVIVGWVHGGPIIEIASEDPRQGMIFYKIGEKPDGKVHLDRDVNCLSCHVSPVNSGLPSTLMRSVYIGADGTPLPELGGFVTDDRSPFAQRWGGWYVTGATGSAVHMGNEDVAAKGRVLGPMVAGEPHTPESLEGLGLFDTNSYLSPYSDVVALMVFEHEIHMMNLLTEVGWKTRLALYQREQNPSWGARRATEHVLRDTSREFVDYMLFADEAPLTDKVRGTSGFEEEFSKRGPDDSQGRSLRQFDLQCRLMRYPCSFMIYSDAFDGLPDEAKSAIYQRMWQILSGQDLAQKYRKLSLADRKAIVEILRDTKKRLPDYFQASAIAR